MTKRNLKSEIKPDFRVVLNPTKSTDFIGVLTVPKLKEEILRLGGSLPKKRSGSGTNDNIIKKDLINVYETFRRKNILYPFPKEPYYELVEDWANVNLLLAGVRSGWFRYESDEPLIYILPNYIKSIHFGQREIDRLYYNEHMVRSADIDLLAEKGEIEEKNVVEVLGRVLNYLKPGGYNIVRDFNIKFVITNIPITLGFKQTTDVTFINEIISKDFDMNVVAQKYETIRKALVSKIPNEMVWIYQIKMCISGHYLS